MSTTNVTDAGATTTPAPTPATTQGAYQGSLAEYIWDYFAASLGLTACWVVTIMLLACILLCYRFRPHAMTVGKGGLSTPILIVFTNHLVNNVVFLCSQYGVNFLVGFNRPVINASNWLNTWWSFWVGNYIVAAPAAVFFVTLDRFLALRLTYRYGQHVQQIVSRIALAVVVLLYCFSFLNVMIAWPYHDDCNEVGTEEDPIANRPCLPLLNKVVNYTQSVIKTSLSIANICLGVAFIHALISAKIQNVKDYIVRITVFCELLFDAIPGFLQLFFASSQIFINLNAYVFLMSSMDAAICSAVYAKLLFKIFKGGSGGGGAGEGTGHNGQQSTVAVAPRATITNVSMSNKSVRSSSFQ